MPQKKMARPTGPPERVKCKSYCTIFATNAYAVFLRAKGQVLGMRLVLSMAGVRDHPRSRRRDTDNS